MQAGPFDVGAELAALEANRTDIGAVVSFTGRVRAHSPAGRLVAMTLEHYPGMTERQLEAIAQDAAQRWPIQAGTVIHRHGRLVPGEAIVLVAIASAHRQAAFEAAAFLMDWLKTKAPFWKQEETVEGSVSWVEAKAADDAAAARWGG